MIVADPFHAFRDVCQTKEKFEIDPAQYLSIPQMAWDAMLEKT